MGVLDASEYCSAQYLKISKKDFKSLFIEVRHFGVIFKQCVLVSP